jgi:4-amino-4-deoxy-L-arabinose transferase-like glycosyltransferase
VGPAFLIKGFMVAVPLAAMAPFTLLRRRWLLARPGFWGWLLLGWVPVLLWLGLSLQQYGPAVVGGLLQKLLYLSQSDVYSAGPLYYLWNIPANTAPWCLAAAAGWWLGLRRWSREQRLALLGTPLLLVVLLSCFRTKTPYYGLQITPFLAIAAAAALQRFSQADQARPRWLAWLIAALGALLAVAGVIGLWQAPWPYGLAALGLGLSWLVLPWQRQGRSVLIACLAGPWLALLLLVQAGLFTDRSPQTRQALAAPAVAGALRQGPVAVVAPEPLSGDGHAQLILLALATPQLGPRLNDVNALAPGQRAWVPKRLGESAEGAALQPLASGDDLGEWMLVQARP